MGSTVAVYVGVQECRQLAQLQLLPVRVKAATVTRNWTRQSPQGSRGQSENDFQARVPWSLDQTR